MTEEDQVMQVESGQDYPASKKPVLSVNDILSDLEKVEEEVLHAVEIATETVSILKDAPFVDHDKIDTLSNEFFETLVDVHKLLSAHSYIMSLPNKLREAARDGGVEADIRKINELADRIVEGSLDSV